MYFTNDNGRRRRGRKNTGLPTQYPTKTGSHRGGPGANSPEYPPRVGSNFISAVIGAGLVMMLIYGSLIYLYLEW